MKSCVVLSFALLCVYTVSAQQTDPAPSFDVSETETSHYAVPPYPRAINPFISMSPQFITYPRRIPENRNADMKNEFSGSVAVGATFQFHWKESGGGGMPFSVAYFREYKFAERYLDFGTDGRIVQGLELSLGASVPSVVLPGLRFAMIGRVGRHGRLHKEDDWRHLGRKLYHGVGPDQDRLAGFGGVKISYAVRHAPWGKTHRGYMVEIGSTIAYGAGHCNTNLSVTIYCDNPKKRLR